MWKLLLAMAMNKIRAKGAFHRAARRDVRLTESFDITQSSQATEQAHADESPLYLQLVVREALEQLDERQREMVELRLQGHGIVEIAELTGRSKRTVERILQDVRAKLSDLLGRDE